MLYSIKNVEELENSNELVSLQNQVEAVRLQNKLGKQKFHKDMKKFLEPVTELLENTSENLTKTITQTSIKNNQAKENLNNKIRELSNDRGVIASYFFSLLSEITNPENTTQFKLVKGYSSNRVIGLLSLGYKPTKTKNADNAVLNKDNAINIDKVKINSIIWYVKMYTPILSQQNILMNQIVRKKSTELQYPERSLFMKEVNTQNWWTFKLGNQEVINVPIWIFVFFQRNDRQHDQNLNNDTFCRMPITSAQFFIGNEKYPDICHLLNYDDDDYAQG